jgi:hypothetical protein
MKSTVVCIIAILALGVPTTAKAQMFNMAKSWMPVGVTGGLGSGGAFGGAEASIVQIYEPFMLGGYADIIRGGGGTRISFGPEIIFPIEWPFALGLDGGYALWFNSARNGDGFTVRIFAVSYVTPYIRYSRIGSESLVDVGVLVKMPIPLK